MAHRETIANHAFSIEVAEDVLTDLKERLERTRWPNAPSARPWAYGMERDYLRALLDHWRDVYDWRAEEARLNALSHYRVPVGDHQLHVIVEPGSGPSPAPLLLLNGWPSSFVELAGAIAPLAHPERFGGRAEDGFTVIVPSYPGYGFSSTPAAPIGAREIARVIHLLMTETLGFDRYLIHGGDWGATIGSWIGFDAPEGVAALHVNSPVLRQPLEGLDLDEDEKAYLTERARRLEGEGAYQAIQATKPQTLSYGLTDSPAGLAAWVVEKFHGWVVPGSEGPPPFPMDLLLTNVMVYWLNGINAANWLYCDLVGAAAVTLPRGGRVAVPTALFQGDRDLPPASPDQWIRRSYDLVERQTQPGMGHFPFVESAAAAQISHMRSFFAKYRGGTCSR